MRLVITGAHGVGKTTLCNNLLYSLQGRLHTKLIPETARALVAKGIPMNDGVSEFGVVSYVLTYLRSCRDIDADVVISDRSIFDLYVYLSDSRRADVREEYADLVKELVYQEITSVSTFIYVPIEFKMPADDVRPPDDMYQLRIDKKLQQLLEFFNARVLRVNGSLEERTNAILQYLDV